MAKTQAELIQDNTDIVTGQTTPESITQTSLGNHLENIIYSIPNINDFNSRSLTRLEILAEVTAGTLIDKQYIYVTGRTNGQLKIQCEGNNKISPYATWIKNNKTILVAIDFVNGYDGETETFIAEFGGSTGVPANDRVVRLNNPFQIYDGSQKSGAVLGGDFNGLATWQRAGSGTTNREQNTGLITYDGSGYKTFGEGFLLQTGKTGKIMYNVYGQYISNQSLGMTIGVACNSQNNNFVFGDLVSENFVHTKFTETPVANQKRFFGLTNIVTFPIGINVAFDVAFIATGAGIGQTAQIYGLTMCAIEL